MDKMSIKRAAWQKTFVMKGSLGVDLKEHWMRLEQEAMGGSPHDNGSFSRDIKRVFFFGKRRKTKNLTVDLLFQNFTK